MEIARKGLDLHNSFIEGNAICSNKCKDDYQIHFFSAGFMFPSKKLKKKSFCRLQSYLWWIIILNTVWAEQSEVLCDLVHWHLIICIYLYVMWNLKIIWQNAQYQRCFKELMGTNADFSENWRAENQKSLPAR